MKRLSLLLSIVMTVGALALLGPASTATAQAPTAGGVASENVEWVNLVPFEQATSTGVTIRGKYMYLTSWKNISIYDISDPINPVQLDSLPVGFMFENEEVSVSPNGKILLFSESLPNDILHIYDVEDKTNIVEFAGVPGAGDHTATCILKCKWVYGSDGSIVDIRDPKNPKLVAGHGTPEDWHMRLGLIGGAHHVREYKHGFILVSPLDEVPLLVDVRNPLKPKLVATGDGPKGWTGERGYLWHSGQFPRNGKDRWLLMGGEDVINPPKSSTCNDKQGPFSTFDARNYQKTHKVRQVDVFGLSNGTYADGNPAVNGMGCTAHWFTEHPDFHNGGLVAISWYDHGTRFLSVDAKGKINEEGYFMAYAGESSAAYWVTDEIVYSVDYTRGIDILRWTGKNFVPKR